MIGCLRDKQMLKGSADGSRILICLLVTYLMYYIVLSSVLVFNEDINIIHDRHTHSLAVFSI